MSSKIGAVVLVLSLLATACSATAEPGDEADSEDALRALSAQEIVGSMAYGETKTIAYSSVPTYRALSFVAAAGDAVTLDVAGAAGADARAWLVRSTFSTLASNDDAAPGVKDARLQYTFRKGGTYYVVVREKHGQATNLSVTLSRRGAVAPPPDGGSPPPVVPPVADLHPSLPLGPVNLHLDGYGRGGNAGHGVPIHIKCDLAGTNPGPVNVSCVALAEYDGMGFAATGTMSGDGARVTKNYRAHDSLGVTHSEVGNVSLGFIQGGDSLYVRLTAQYEAVDGFQRRSFATLVPAVLTITQGQSKPVEKTGDDRTCDSICADAGMKCLYANVAAARWVTFEGCPSLSNASESSGSCQSLPTRRSGFTGEICDFQLRCQCI